MDASRAGEVASCTSLQGQLRTIQQPTFHQSSSGGPIVRTRQPVHGTRLEIRCRKLLECLHDRTASACACATRQCHRDLRLLPHDNDNDALNSIGNLGRHLRGLQTSWASSKARAVPCARLHLQTSRSNSRLSFLRVMQSSKRIQPLTWGHCDVSLYGLWYLYLIAWRNLGSKKHLGVGKSPRKRERVGNQRTLFIMDGFYIIPSWRLPRVAD
jgi:hypothetical protein